MDIIGLISQEQTAFGAILLIVAYLLVQSRRDNMAAQKRANESTDKFTNYLAEKSGEETLALTAAAEGFRTVSKSLEILNRQMSTEAEKHEHRHDVVLSLLRKIESRDLLVPELDLPGRAVK